MQIVIKKSIKFNNLKLYKELKHMELIRIYPKTRIKTNISEVKIKIFPKKFKKPKFNELYVMKVYFSTMLLNELSWSNKNSIAVFKDNKNINNYLFKLADDNRGFKINTNKDINYIQFTIDNMIDKYKDLTTANFEITDNSLKIML
jgi:hypothetical protein